MSKLTNHSILAFLFQTALGPLALDEVRNLHKSARVRGTRQYHPDHCYNIDPHHTAGPQVIGKGRHHGLSVHKYAL